MGTDTERRVATYCLTPGRPPQAHAYFNRDLDFLLAQL